MSGEDWGPWHLNRRNLTLEHPYYEVDLERCLSCAETLDIIAQVAGKRWATDEVLGALVRALNDLLRPQANLCPFGQGRRFRDPVQWFAAIRQGKALS